MDTVKCLSNCSMNVTPEVLNMVCGINKEAIRIGEFITEKEMRLQTKDGIIVKINYTDGMKGDCYLAVDEFTYNHLVAAMMGIQNVEELDVSKEIKTSAICELMNQLIGNIISSLTEVSKNIIDISCPEIIEQNILHLQKNSKVVINLFTNPLEAINLKLINVLEA